jgi:hypothetical protein
MGEIKRIALVILDSRQKQMILIAKIKRFFQSADFT